MRTLDFGSPDRESVALVCVPNVLKKMVSAEGIESATKRTFNNMQGHG
jgi:hypothetical protein